MLEVFDKERKKLAVLQNATNISEKITLNAIGVFSFSMPSDDDKNIYCKAFNMVSLNGGELYRIIKKGESESYKSMINYQCEHVLSNLLNTSLYGYHVVGNIGVYTADVINYLLSKQKDWVLYECDFNRQFEYGWEQENLLSALLGIANRFTEKYKWVTDTTVYPWRLSLKRIDENALPIAYVHKGYNQMQLTKDIDYSKIVTRLYAL
ncbi:MAG: phage tail spike protein, partial [Oscillospiraceae bacterium]